MDIKSLHYQRITVPFFFCWFKRRCLNKILDLLRVEKFDFLCSDWSETSYNTSETINAFLYVRRSNYILGKRNNGNEFTITRVPFSPEQGKITQATRDLEKIDRNSLKKN